MSRRREVERPQDVARDQAEAFALLRANADAAAAEAASRPEARAAIEVSRTVMEDRAAFAAGSGHRGRRNIGAPSVEERYDILWSYAPHGRPLTRLRVRPQAVEAVLRVPYVSARADSTMMGTTYRFGLWADETRGSFDWRRDLTTGNIEAFAAETLGHCGEHTRNSYRSTLHRVRRGGDIAIPTGRKVGARAGYPRVEWDKLMRAAEIAEPCAEDLTTHLSLSGGAGLRTNEVPWAQSSWVHESADGLFIRVPNEHGEFREVPLLGRYADAIGAAAIRNEGTYLVAPQLQTRTNVLSYLKKRVRGTHPVIAEYDVARARHTWIARMLAVAVPGVVIAEVADINKSTSLLADLLCEMDRPDLSERFRALSIPGIAD